MLVFVPHRRSIKPNNGEACGEGSHFVLERAEAFGPRRLIIVVQTAGHHVKQRWGIVRAACTHSTRQR